MGKISKPLALILTIIVAVSCLPLLAFKTVSAQTNMEAGTGEPTGPKQLWNFNAQGSVYSVTVNSKLVFACSTASLGSGLIYAINSSNGKLLWDTYTDGVVQFPPVFADGVLYAGSNGFNFYAINASDGSLIWNFTIKMVEGSPSVSNGVVYLASFGPLDSNVYALNALTGQVIWNYSFGVVWGYDGPYTWLTSIVEGYGAVYVIDIDGASNPALYAIDKSSGVLLWKAPIGVGTVTTPYTSPCVAEGKVFVGCAINYRTEHREASLLAFDAANGNLIWNKTGPVGGFSTPVFSNGRIYVISGGIMQAVKASDGALLWNISDGSFSVPTISDDKLYVSTGFHSWTDPNGNLFVINASTGQTIRNYETKGARYIGESGPAYKDGTIYFSHDNTVSALGGALIGTPSPVTPTLNASTVSAKTSNGSTVDLTISGNITSSQMSNVTITTNQSVATTTIDFTLIGQSGNTGFSNITILKTDIPYGNISTVYIDNQPAQNQSCTQDSNNYYVWYTTEFSAHQISIIFSSSPHPSPASSEDSSSNLSKPFPTMAIVIVSGVIALILAVAGLLVYIKKHKQIKTT